MFDKLTKKYHHVLVVLILVAVLLVGYTAQAIHSFSADFNSFKYSVCDDMDQVESTLMLTAEWVDDRGITRKVTTTKNSEGSETEAEFQTRHDDRVKAQLVLYPQP